MKNTIYLIIICILFCSCRREMSEESFFKDIKPGISRDEYNRYIDGYKRAAVLDSNGTLHLKKLRFTTELEGDYPMKNFLNYYCLRFEDEKQNDKKLTMTDLKNLSKFFSQIYGRPDSVNVADTTKYGCNYLEWNKLPDYVVKLDYDRSRGTNTIRLYMWAKPLLANQMERNRGMGYTFSNDANLDHYLKSIVFGHNLDSIAKCATRDFREKKYYIFSGEIWGDSKYSFMAKYAREKYGLRFVVISDMRFRGEDAYMDTMGKLMMTAKMPGSKRIWHEADSLYFKTHKKGTE